MWLETHSVLHMVQQTEMVDENVVDLQVVLDTVQMVALVIHSSYSHTLQEVVPRIPKLEARSLGPHHIHSAIHLTRSVEQQNRRKRPIDQDAAAFLARMVCLLGPAKESTVDCFK